MGSIIETHAVIPTFDGTAVLPRYPGWSGLRSRLLSGPVEFELDRGFYDSPLGRRYERQLRTLGLEPAGAAVRLDATEGGFAATLRLHANGRELEDLWLVEVDSNGLLREFEAEHHTGDFAYDPESFSRFFDSILARA